MQKNPNNLTDEQAGTLRKLKRRGGDLWRAYTLKEAFRATFAGDLDTITVTELIDRWISKASRSRLPAFVKAAKTIRKNRDGILTAIRTGIPAPGAARLLGTLLDAPRAVRPAARGSVCPTSPGWTPSEPADDYCQ